MVYTEVEQDAPQVKFECLCLWRLKNDKVSNDTEPSPVPTTYVILMHYLRHSTYQIDLGISFRILMFGILTNFFFCL